MLSGNVLLLEDFGLTALESEDLLKSLGADCVMTARSVEKAMDIVAAAELSMAVLEVALAAESCKPVADALYRAQTPFIIATGYVRENDLVSRFPGAPVIEKPYDRETLSGAIAIALSARE